MLCPFIPFDPVCTDSSPFLSTLCCTVQQSVNSPTNFDYRLHIPPGLFQSVYRNIYFCCQIIAKFLWHFFFPVHFDIWNHSIQFGKKIILFYLIKLYKCAERQVFSFSVVGTCQINQRHWMERARAMVFIPFP